MARRSSLGRKSSNTSNTSSILSRILSLLILLIVSFLSGCTNSSGQSTSFSSIKEVYDSGADLTCVTADKATIQQTYYFSNQNIRVITKTGSIESYFLYIGDTATIYGWSTQQPKAVKETKEDLVKVHLNGILNIPLAGIKCLEGEINPELFVVPETLN